MKLGAGLSLPWKVAWVTKAGRLVAQGIMRFRTFSGNEQFMPKQATGASLQ